ncbi:MAG: tetratricopeptide repeat protein [Candidatus Cloacimonetes bacterium]|nr:tetratricopeptide repeat protein [Candidatus Cloacimonadota bacterium]
MMEENIKELIGKLETTTEREQIIYSLKIGDFFKKKREFSEGLKYYLNALEQAEKLNLNLLTAKCMTKCGISYRVLNQYDQSLKYYSLAIQIFESLNSNFDLSQAYLNCGTVYWKLGNYARSLEFYFSSLKIKEKLDEKIGIASCYNNIGLVYWKLHNNEKALNFFFKALKIKKEFAGKESIAITYNNLGNIFYDQDNMKKAVINHQKSLDISIEIYDKDGEASSLNNLGADYKKLNKLKKSLSYYFQSLDLKLQLKKIESSANTYKNIGKIFHLQGKTEDALEYLHKALHIHEGNKSKLIIKDCYFELSEIYEIKGDLILALKFLKKYLEVTKTIRDDIDFKKIADIEIEIIKEKNQKLSELNKKILDSIEYASLIQNSILPRNEELTQYIKNYFIIWKPKDIVGGDFYWFFPIPKSKNYIISVIDCTGHGVPGAFMSMTANSILNNIVREKKIYEPDKILNLLHKEIRYTLRQQSREAQQDGMDISICYIDVDLQEIRFSGAMQHLYLLKKGKKEEWRNGEREEKILTDLSDSPQCSLNTIKGNRFSIGGKQKEEERIFTKHTIHYNSGDSVYLLSDGLADQKVRIDDKETRLKIKRVKEILLKYCSLPMNEQKEKIEEESMTSSRTGGLKYVNR